MQSLSPWHVALLVLGGGSLAMAGPIQTEDVAMIDGNRAVVEQFVDLFYRQKRVREAFECCVSAAHYVQHNPNMPDGREAAITALAPKFGSAAFQADVKRVVVDGDLAMVHLHARMLPDTRGAAVVDIFRLEGGLIVEHWDVLQPVPEHALSKHPMF